MCSPLNILILLYFICSCLVFVTLYHVIYASSNCGLLHFLKKLESCIFAPVTFTDLRLKIWIIVKIKNKEHDSDMKQDLSV